MAYQQSITTALGKHGLSESDFIKLKTEALLALDSIKSDENLGKLPIISITKDDKGLNEINSFASKITQNFDNLVVLGTGGSSLCGHAMAGFAENRYGGKKPKVIFHENIDPHTFDDFFTSIDLAKTAFLTISKSGDSIETITQMNICLNKAAKKTDVSKNFFSITLPGETTLRRISNKHGITVFDHAPDISGRFSILTNVGLMPGAVAGLDVKEVRKGALEFFENDSELAAESAALHLGFMRAGIWQNVFMTYPDKLQNLNIWYRQIWAESLGKNGAGSTPINANGTIDQHSQMQLYIAGRRDKFYNFVILKMPTDKFKITGTEKEFDYLNGKTLGHLINAEQQATIDTLVNNGRPVRVIELSSLSAKELGMLTAHLILETIITARLLGVNPYDQPAVEEGKIKTKAALKNS